jgi:hypothetical protein
MSEPTLLEQYQVDVPAGRSGPWSIERVTVSEQQAEHDNVMSCIGGHGGRYVRAGTYTALYRDGGFDGKTIVMSDTPDEIHDHLRFIQRARGDVLIAGLGLGMVLQAVARKPDVRSVFVIEQSEDVIGLVSPHYYQKPYGDKIRIGLADIMTWEPPKGARWTCAWFDIWDDLCTDNLTEMAKLHRRYARRVDDYGSWGHGLLKARRDQERRMGW